MQYGKEQFASRSCQHSRLAIHIPPDLYSYILGQRVCDLNPFPAATLPELKRWLVEQWQRIP